MEISDCSEAKKSKLSSTDDNIEQSNGDLLETTLVTAERSIEEGSQPGPSQDNKDDDSVSVISGLSDMSGKGWKPDMSGKVGWLHRAMSRGTDPREIVSNLFKESGMLNTMDDLTIWKILFNMFSQPPRREKLKDFNTLEDVARCIKQSKNILVLTGAGVSVSCGIPDFRSKDGVYSRLAVDFPDLPDPQAMFDIQYFRKDPRPFFKFAKEIYPGQFSPSPCHRFIYCLEKAGKLLRNYTQNIDTLEQVAGISKIVQCHGSFATASCTICKVKVSAELVREDIMKQNIPLCPKCPTPDLQDILSSLSKAKEETAESDPSALSPTSSSSSALPNNNTVPPQLKPGELNAKPGAADTGIVIDDVHMPCLDPVSPFTSVPIMKPDIVFFGEGLSDEFHTAISKDKEKADLLIVIGSSLKVRPVALIPSSIPETVPQILINRERLSHLTFDVELLGDCDTIINQLCHMLEGDWSHPIHQPPLKQIQNFDLSGSMEDSDNLEDSKSSSELDVPETETTGDLETNVKAESAILKEGPGDGDKMEPGNSLETGTEKSVTVAENSATGADQSVTVTDQSGTMTEKSATGMEKHVAGAENEDDDDENSLDRTRESEEWKPKPSLSESLPEGRFLFIPPNRYVFSGAEVQPEDLSDNEEYDEDDDDEDEDLEEEGEEKEDDNDENEKDDSKSEPDDEHDKENKQTVEAETNFVENGTGNY